MNRRRLNQLMEQWKRGWSLPQAFYTDAEIFAHDLEQIYYRYWLYAGHAGQLRQPGDFFTYEIGKESIVVIRNKQGEINAFYNVCPHRGSRICLSPSGNHRTLTCPYHQWSFNLEGELLNSRMMGADFDRTAFGLRRVAMEVLEDLVFVCLAEEPPSFECMRTDVLPQLQPAGMTRAKMIYSETYDVPANWKLITENFRECYHCHIGHPEYIRAVEGIHKFDELRVADSVSRWRQMGFITEGIPFTESSWHHCHRYPFHQGYVTESIDGKPVSSLMGAYTEADMGTFCIVTYPNFWFESSSDHAVTMQHTPISATHTRVVMSWFVDGNAVEGKDYEIDNVIAFWKRTGEQDWKLCADNQAGVNSRAYQPGPYAPSEIELPKFHDWYFSQIMNEVDFKSVTLQQKYRQVREEGWALLATNFYNYETLHGVVEAAKATRCPIILQLTRSSIEYLGLRQALSMARIESSIHGIQTWVHLDHGDSVELAVACVDAGFDSVMIDASEQSLEENIRLTREVVRYAHRYGVCVEAELGYVAKLGQTQEGAGFTEPEEAKYFVKQTEVDALAVAIGSAHGFYKKTPQLDIERLARINMLAQIPMVLHGASGIPDDALRAAVNNGISKINLATEIKHTFMRRIKNDLLGSDEIDLRKVFPPAIGEVRELVIDKLLTVSRREG